MPAARSPKRATGSSGLVERMKVTTRPRVTVFAIDPQGDVRSA